MRKDRERTQVVEFTKRVISPFIEQLGHEIKLLNERDYGWDCRTKLFGMKPLTVESKDILSPDSIKHITS